MIVVFKLWEDASDGAVADAFGRYGAVRGVRASLVDRVQRFIEFRDSRDAATAPAAADKESVLGFAVTIQFSRPSQYMTPAAGPVVTVERAGIRASPAE